MDLQILEWINNNLHANKVLNHIWMFITSSGDIALVWIILCSILLMIPKTRKMGVIMFLALGANVLIVDGFLKHVFLRVRPYNVSPDLSAFLDYMGYKKPNTHSFPSGHASTSFAVAIAYVLQDKKWGRYAMVWAGLIALSRCYMGVHYPTDIIVGTIIGLIVGTCVYFIANKIINKWIAEKTNAIKVYPMLYKSSLCEKYAKII